MKDAATVRCAGRPHGLGCRQYVKPPTKYCRACARRRPGAALARVSKKVETLSAALTRLLAAREAHDAELVDVVPQTLKGEDGLTSIMARGNVSAWVESNVVRLVKEGYVRLVINTHLSTTRVGDKLARRKRA